MNVQKRILLKPALGVAAVLAIAFWHMGGVVLRDFVAFQAAGITAWEAPEKLYDLKEQLRVQKTLGLKDDDFVPFPYPPVVAFLFVPARFLSVQGFYITLLAVNLLLFFAALWLAIKRLNLDKQQAETMLLVASTTFPVYFTLIAGQLAFVSMLLYSLFAIELLKKDSGKAGFWVGVLSFKPSLMVLPFLILIWRKDWKNVIWAFAVTTAMTAIALPVVGKEGLHQQFELLSTMGTHPLALRNVPAMQNLRAISYYFGLGDIGWAVASALVVAGLVVALHKREWDRWTISALLLAVVLTTPHLHAYDLAILIVLPVLGFSTGSWYQRFYVAVGLLPLIQFAFHREFPATALVLLAVFWLCVYKAREGAKTPLDRALDPKPQRLEVGAGDARSVG